MKLSVFWTDRVTITINVKKILCTWLFFCKFLLIWQLWSYFLGMRFLVCTILLQIMSCNTKLGIISWTTDHNVSHSINKHLGWKYGKTGLFVNSLYFTSLYWCTHMVAMQYLTNFLDNLYLDHIVFYAFKNFPARNSRLIDIILKHPECRHKISICNTSLPMHNMYIPLIV